MIDSGWRYFDMQMCHTRRLGTFLTDITDILSCSNGTDNSLTSTNYKETLNVTLVLQHIHLTASLKTVTLINVLSTA